MTEATDVTEVTDVTWRGGGAKDKAIGTSTPGAGRLPKTQVNGVLIFGGHILP